MKFLFNIDYSTHYGEAVVLNVEAGGELLRKMLETRDGQRWSGDMDLDAAAIGHGATYYYTIERDGQPVRREWAIDPHRLDLFAKKASTYTRYDRFNEMPEDSYLYSSAYTDCFNQEQLKKARPTSYAKTVRLIVRAPQLRKGERLALIGGNGLGDWQALKALEMVNIDHNEWALDLDAEKLPHHLEFKFVGIDTKHDVTPMWETGVNREMDIPEMPSGNCIVYELDQAFFELWNRKFAGTLVPVFSLRSKESFGVGDFGDLCRMIDLVALTGQRVLQVLPINDTTMTHTWVDSYPYSCISIFALHPQYADLAQLPELKDEKRRKYYKELQQELNSLRQIDYERVNDAKIAYLHEVYDQEHDRIEQDSDYRAFIRENGSWLVPYAQYCHLRDTLGTADFHLWKGHEQWQEKDRRALTTRTTKAYKEVSFYYFVQFVLDRQMRHAHDYAREHGVVLKGDIPIGVNRNGCDVWTEPRYFNLDSQAGAPPDDFSVNGQNWGFPTYNWDQMLQDGCRWWLRRFGNMAKYFDAYRIDHVLGFFRIWSIPDNAVHGLLGQFDPAIGMTPEEIRSYGLNFQEERFTEPFITDWVLDRVFHEHANEVRERYLEPIDGERYRLRPEVDTQRKVEALFRGKDSKDDIWLRDGLYALISDVLFVRDRKDAAKFHPRISAQFDFIYESLYDNDKNAFNKLYNEYFYRRHNQFWYDEAMKKLPLLVNATRMLVCAEDLGMVPSCVPWVMNQLRILSLELQSMPKDPTTRFGHLSRNPYRSVSTISSHDMPTLRMWWDEDYERTQAYYNTMLYRGGAAPHPLPGWLAKDIITRHLDSPSMLCILSLQDWLAISEDVRLADENAERINIPANPHHYWRYRMHLNIEDLKANKELVGEITEMVKQAGR